MALLLLTFPAFPKDDAQSIIQHSVLASNADWEAAPKFDHCEREHLQAGGSNTYDVLMILGSPYHRLVAINDKPLSKDEQAEQQQKLESAITEREHETEQERNQRISEYEKNRKRDNLLLQQLTEAFEFHLDGKQKVDGRETYVLNAVPRSDYQPPNMQTRVLAGMRGTLWIDDKTFQWVKVKADVVHPVSIEGFLAKVEPGTQFQLEKKPVSGDIWLPSHFSMKSKAKVLFLFTRRSTEEEDYFDYREAGPPPISGVSAPTSCQPPQ